MNKLFCNRELYQIDYTFKMDRAINSNLKYILKLFLYFFSNKKGTQILRIVSSSVLEPKT